MARPDLYGMPETDASKLQGDNDVLRAENERLRDLLAFNGLDPDAIIESAKGAAQKRK